MRNIFYKGENILVRWSVVDKQDNPIAFSTLNDVIVKVIDRQGNSQTFSKVASGNNGTIVQGATSNQYQFELTESMTAGFSSGKLSAKFTYKIPSVDHASLQMVDIIEEGINSEFITLQE